MTDHERRLRFIKARAVLINAKADQKREAMVDRLRPLLVRLLDRAQARLRDPIRFYQGMGTWLLSLDSDQRRREFRFQDTFSFAINNPECDRLRSRFPELCEFLEIIDACDDHLDTAVGDLQPSVPPRRTTRELAH